MQLQNTPTAGQRTAHRNLKFGYFSQHHVDQLDMSVCPVELMAQHFPGKENYKCLARPIEYILDVQLYMVYEACELNQNSVSCSD